MQPQCWGDFVATEILSETSLGTVYKALNLHGEPRLHYVKVFPAAVAACPPALTLLQMHSARWHGLRDLYTLHLESSGLAGDHFVASIEYRQGRLLSEILARCGREGIPLAPDQAVYLAERIAGALLSLSTQDQFAGALSPEEVLVTFEGEVKLFPSLGRDLATTDLRADGLLDALLAYQPEEVQGGKKARAAADRFALGALLFEFLLHQPLRPEGETVEIGARLEEAKAGLGMDEPLPLTLAAVLEKALLQGEAGAYETIDAFKVDLDALITSGEYSPSTFNMAFLMHTLFRDEEEAEARKDEEWLLLDREPFRAAPEPPPEEEESEKPKPKRRFVMPPPAQEDLTEPNFTVAEEPSKKGLWISLGVTALVVVIAVLVWLAFGNRGPSEAELRAQKLEKELTAQKEDLKRQQQDLADKLAAAEKEKQDLQGKMSTAKTADERVKAQKALDEAQKKIEAQRLQAAALQEKAAATPASPSGTQAGPPKSAPPLTPTSPESTPSAVGGVPSTSTPTASPEVVPAPETAPATAPAVAAVKPGDFVELFAVSIRPREVQGLKVEYTPMARSNRLQGTIYLEVDIDETGAVTAARAVRAPNPDFGMGDALVKATSRMKYTPAIKDGVPVKTKLTFPVRLEMK